MKGWSPFLQEKKTVTAGRMVEAKRQPNLDSLSFKKAFRKARNAGVKKFTWKDESYTTEVE